MQKLEELIVALKEAAGPSRELDAEIDKLVSNWSHLRKAVHADTQEAFVLPTVPHFTASIDAAVALIEQVLPGAFWIMSRGRLQIEEPLYAIELLFGTDEILGEAESNSLPIAICLAVLRAKLSQEKNT